MPRERKFKSKKEALIKKSRESMLAAVQIFNNPLIKFKSEAFLVLSVIAWTYLFHAYYEQIGVDYRYYKLSGKRKVFDKTEFGAIKEWELSKCIKAKESPINDPIKKNLEFIIGLRNEVEHQMTGDLDKVVSAKLQACAINYNHCITEWFGSKKALDAELIMTIQFTGVDPIKQRELSKMKGLAPNVYNYISDFEQNLDSTILTNKEYSYKIMYIPISANKKGQADSVIEFTKLTDEQEEQVQNCPEILTCLERYLRIKDLIKDYMKKSKYYCFIYRFPIGRVIFDGRDDLTVEEKQLHLLNQVAYRLYQYRVNPYFLFDHDNPALRLKNNDNASVDFLVSTEIITSDMIE